MTSTFSLRGLPHFALDSHRALLRQVELHEPDHLRGVVNYLERIGWNKVPPAPELPQDIVQATSAKYVEALRILTGRDLQ